MLGGGSATGGSASHGGFKVAVEYHATTTKRVAHPDDGQRCLESVESGTLRVLVAVRIEHIDGNELDVPSVVDIINGGTLVCGGDEYDIVSLSHMTTDTDSVERFVIGFQVNEGFDASPCELELTWQGESASMETVRLGLGAEREPERLDIYEPCGE